jgi:hypothetical protein
MPTAVLSFRRGEGKNTVVSVINISGKPLKTHVSGMAGSISPLLVTGATADAQGAFTLDAFGFFIGRNAPGNSAD